MSAQTQCKHDLLQYVETENRPFSLVDLDNALKNHGKSTIAKCIDELIEEGKLKEKVYGKQRVFVYNQSLLPVYDETELRAMESEISSLNRELANVQQRLKQLTAEFKKVSSTLTEEEAKRELSFVEAELSKAESEITRLRDKGPTVSAEDFNKVSVDRDRFLTEWRKRKRIAMDIIDAVAEGYPKSKKQLITDVGIETDEDCGVVLPART